MRKKVLLIATVQSHIGQFHKPLMKMLKDRGWEIHVAARDNLAEKNGLQLEYPDKIFNIPFQRSPFDKRNILAYREIKKILADNQYDVIHCNTPVGGIVGRLAGNRFRKTGTQVFYTAHGFHFYKGAPVINWLIYYPIEKWMSRYTDKLITITNEDYQTAKSFHCPVFHIHGVGANSTKYYPITIEEQEKRKRALGLEGHLVVNVGELLPNKNQKTAILAMEKVIKYIPDVKLIIAGNGSEKANLENLVAQHGLENHIKLIGYTTKLEQYLQVCDLELACSYREGLPLNVMEAMLCGKPVVGSNNRGHRELIKAGLNGYLVEADDIAGFSRAICRLLRKKKNEAAIVNSIIPYTDTRVQKELQEIYEISDLKDNMH